MKKYLLFVFLILGLCKFNYAQEAVFIVLDAETKHPLDSVVVHSRLEKNEPGITDIGGKTSLHIAEEDTISFDKNLYYHVHIIIDTHQNYDFKHTILVYLTPMSHPQHEAEMTDINDFNSFKYKFTHEDVKNNQFKIRVLEHDYAADKRSDWLEHTRNQYGKDFNVIDIKLSEKK